MIPKICTACKQPSTAPLTWCVVAWMDGNHVRHAWQMKVCPQCFSEHLALVYIKSQDPVLICPACGIGTVDDYDACYGTFVPKGVGKMQFEAPFCAACAAHFRIWVCDSGVELVDQSRGAPQDGVAPRYTAAETLAALGLPDGL